MKIVRHDPPSPPTQTPTFDLLGLTLSEMQSLVIAESGLDPSVLPHQNTGPASMNHIDRLLNDAVTWPLLYEYRTSVMMNLMKLQPPAKAEIDLPIAYAMAVWQELRCDWRTQL